MARPVQLARAPGLVVRRDGADGDVLVAGELDLANVATLRTCLETLTEGRRELVLDVSGLTFIDATGLSALLAAHLRLAAAGGRLVVVGASPLLRRLAAITRLDTRVALR